MTKTTKLKRTDEVLTILLHRENTAIKKITERCNRISPILFPRSFTEELQQAHNQLGETLTNILASAPEIAREKIGVPPEKTGQNEK